MQGEKAYNAGWFAPMLFMGLISFLALGLYWGRLGFFWDDWAIYWWTKMGGLEGLIKSTSKDRITVGLIAWIIDRLLNFNPLTLQIILWALWLGTGVVFQATLRRVWPEQKLPALVAALLMLVYPGFSLLHVSIVAINLVLALGLEITSIYLSLVYLTARTRRDQVVLALTAIILAAIAWNIYEASFFNEPLRVALVLVWGRQGASSGGNIRAVMALARCWPWWLADFLYLVQRTFLSASKRGAAEALSQFSASPMDNFVRIFVDWINALVYVWLYPPLAKCLGTSSLHVTIAMLVAGLGGLAWILYVWRLGEMAGGPRPSPEEASTLELFGPGLVVAVAAAGIIFYSVPTGLNLKIPQPQVLVGVCLAAVLSVAWRRGRGRTPAWAWQWMVVGAACALVGLALVGFAGKNPVLNNLRDRWNLPAIVGACIFCVGALGLLRNRTAQSGFIALLLFLGLVFHYCNGYQFLVDWKLQRSLAWQLWQRAPQIDPGTILVLDPGQEANQATLKYYSIFGLTSAVYSQNRIDRQLGQAIMRGGKDKKIMQNLAKAEPSTQGSRQTLFPVDWSKVLVLALADKDSCLYVADRAHPLLPDTAANEARAAVVYSRWELIKPERGPAPPPSIFGKQPCDWCSYYQRAQLARQLGQWQTVVDLYQEAIGQGLSPNRAEELLPFIEGMVKIGQRNKAESLATVVKTHNLAYAQVEAIMAETKP